MINSDVLKQFNVTMEELTPKIIDSIVGVYGEKNRTIIQDRLKTIYINTYITYEDVNNYYNFIIRHKEDLLSLKFLEDMGIDLPQDITDEVYKNGTYYLKKEHSQILETYFGYRPFTDDSPIFSFDDDSAEDLEDYSTRRKLQNRCDVLSKLGYSVTLEDYHSFSQTEEGKQTLSDIHKVYDIALKYKEEFSEFKKEHKDIKNYIAQCDKLKSQLSLKYTQKFFEDLLPMLPEDEKEQVSKALSLPVHSKYELLRMADPNKKYYYESYEKVNPNLSPEMASQVTAIKTNCTLQEDREFFKSTGNYQTCLDTLSSLNLLSEDSFNMDFVKHKMTCVTPNVVKNENGEFQNINIIHLPILAMLKEYRDVLTIHEILHVVELSMKQISENEFHIKTGLDSINMNISNNPFSNEPVEDEYNHHIRPNEYLSENIHHQLAIKITDDLHDKGIYLFDDPQNSKTRGSSSYEQLNSVVLPFMNTFHSDIIDAMIQPDSNALTNKVGQDNINNLNQVVNDYRALPYYKMMNDVINHRDSELTQRRNDLISTAKTIVVQMQEYSKSKDFIITPIDIGKLTVNENIQTKVIAQETVQNDINKVFEKDSKVK